MILRSRQFAARIRQAVCQVWIEPLEARVLLSASSSSPSLFEVAGPSVVSGTPQGLSPAMIEQAYNLKDITFTSGGQTTSATGAGETIAIVDAFADPDIASDLRTFDANFGLSDDDASGNFVLTVATPEGSVSTNAGWALEESLDVEWAHAIAPEADILLVEAPTDSTDSLASAVVWAASQPGVVAVSMSWGDSPEFSGETAYDHDFTTPSGHGGVTFVAASGDDGEPNYPSTSPNVLAVGGTTLTVDADGNFISESAWSDSGGGTSPYEGTNKPDVAYDADENTGFLVYDSLRYQGESGWQVVGGTSAGTPQWAAIIALADQGRSLLSLGSLDGPTQTISDLYALPSSDFNQVSGDGFTGLGSPNGEKIISALVGGGITSVNSSQSSPPGTAAQLAFVQQPTNVTAGTPFSPAVTVDVDDSDGNVITSDNSSVTLSVASGLGMTSGIIVVTAVNGVATFNDLWLDTAGNDTLRAIDGALTSTTSNSFTVSPATASQIVFLQAPTNVWMYGPVTPAVQVALEDGYGNRITSGNNEITLNVSGGAAVGPFTAATVNGIASFGGFSIDAVGTFGLQAVDGSIMSRTVNLDVIAPPTQRYLFNGTPLSPPAVASQERAVATEGPPAPQDSASAIRTTTFDGEDLFAASASIINPAQDSFANAFATDDLDLQSVQDLDDLLQ
jgi:Subtilase family